MEYMSIKQLAAKFAMPERTVYYNIANNKNIRTQKQGRSKFANVVDFAKVCGKELQSLQNDGVKESNNKSEGDIASLQNSLQTLQQEYELDKEKMFSLQKYNNNLESDRNRFIKLHSEEKEEKMELMNKYDALQNKYHQKIESFAKRYYLVLGMCIVLLGILLYLLVPNLFKY